MWVRPLKKLPWLTYLPLNFNMMLHDRALAMSGLVMSTVTFRSFFEWFFFFIHISLAAPTIRFSSLHHPFKNEVYGSSRDDDRLKCQWHEKEGERGWIVGNDDKFPGEEMRGWRISQREHRWRGVIWFPPFPVSHPLSWLILKSMILRTSWWLIMMKWWQLISWLYPLISSNWI